MNVKDKYYIKVAELVHQAVMKQVFMNKNIRPRVTRSDLIER